MADNPFHIHKDRLDEQWAEQPELARGFYADLAEAKRELKEAENRLKVTEAEVSLRVRRSPQEYDLSEKPTEDAVKKTVPLQKEVKRAEKEIVEAQYKVDMCAAACRGIEHKKHGLQDEVVLWSQGYFATPRDPTKGEMDREVGKKTFAPKKRPRNEDRDADDR